MMKVAAFFATIASVSAGALDLSPDNFDDEVISSGKGALVKFLAPWCGHCKKMKPDWDRLGDDFAGSKTVVIADVDCTVHQDLCGKYGVRGYPTIKYFTSSTAADGDAYEGGRDYASLKKFADESLGPSCSNDNLDLCDDDQKAILDKYNAMSADERKAIVDKANQDVADAEETFKEEVKKLQANYEKLMADKDAGIKALQTSELRLLKSIKGDSKDEL